MCKSVEEVFPRRVRLKYGEFWVIFDRPPLPDEHILSAAKDIAESKIVSGCTDFDITCPLCQRRYRIPSELSNVRREGLCGQCIMYSNGKVDCIQKNCEPFLEEVLDRYNRGLSLNSQEIKVLVESVRKIDEKSE